MLERHLAGDSSAFGELVSCYRAPVYGKMGGEYEHLGDFESAVFHYRRFLDLWKDADPGLPELEEARRYVER